MSAERAVEKIIAAINKRIAGIAPFRAVVSSLSAGKVLIIRQGAATADTQAYARLAGFDLAVNDEVLCVNLSGQAIVLGKIQRAAPSNLAVPMLNTPVIKIDRNNTNFTNTDTVNDADAGSTTIVLPAGTWTIYAMGSAVCFHSAVADFQVKVSINADVGASSTLATGSAAGDRVTINPVHSVAGIGSGTITCKLVFHSATAGTMTVDTSSLFVIATRTA